MTLEITTPTGIRKVVKADTAKDQSYYFKWAEKGYTVKELQISTVQDSFCIACEG